MSRELDPVVAACGCVNHFSGQVTHCALHRAAPDLLAAMQGLNHMGGDERGGWCVCAWHDGSAPDEQHSTACADGRAAIRKARA